MHLSMNIIKATELTVHFKWVNYMAYELYLDKAIIKRNLRALGSKVH